jgi:hypothetical protein
MDKNEIPHDPRHLGVPSDASKKIYIHVVRSTQIVHLSCVKISTISRRNEHKYPLEPCHLGVQSGASKTIYGPVVRLAQTMHLPCTDTDTVSKRIETGFNMTHITKEFYRVRPIRFLSLWYIRCKPCIYLASRLALSANRLNRAST